MKPLVSILLGKEPEKAPQTPDSLEDFKKKKKVELLKLE